MVHLFSLVLVANQEEQERYRNLTRNSMGLQERYQTLAAERASLQLSNQALTQERDQLQASTNVLREEKLQLQSDFSQLSTGIYILLAYYYLYIFVYLGGSSK